MLILAKKKIKILYQVVKQKGSKYKIKSIEGWWTKFQANIVKLKIIMKIHVMKKMINDEKF